ncbi:MAG: 1-acyl-sn-glycerol-3-phosphate acyltransferase [Lachnospiraceae bacterium]|nr:1-acyl-sn-glycerol-3-phosphate acyltransferase [Lachnospiraceae bacterium]
MNRIVLMVLRNFWKVPGAYWKLCHYAKHTDEYPEEEKYRHIQYILKTAVETGNIELKVYGKENIPKENGFLMYANHQGLFDIMAIAASCDKPLAAVLKKELAEIPFLKQVKECTHSFSMDREDIKQSMEVILNVIKEVKKGRNYLIFPEGTRSKKGNQMLEFHGGSFKCATKSKCPILPVALIDSFKVLDQKGCKPVSLQIHYLKPIPYEEYQDMNTVELAAMVRSRIESAIKEHTDL